MLFEHTYEVNYFTLTERHGSREKVKEQGHSNLAWEMCPMDQGEHSHRAHTASLQGKNRCVHCGSFI